MQALLYSTCEGCIRNNLGSGSKAIVWLNLLPENEDLRGPLIIINSTEIMSSKTLLDKSRIASPDRGSSARIAIEYKIGKSLLAIAVSVAVKS